MVLLIQFKYYAVNMAKNYNIQVPFDTPVPYRIQVQGRVASKLVRSSTRMDIRQAASDTGYIVSTLTEAANHTALAGVLNALYEMHLTVLSVECLKCV